MERWRDVPGFEGIYRVSDHGRLSSRTPDGRGSYRRYLTRGSRDAYRLVALHDGPRLRRTAMHILMLEAFIGPRPPGMEARHLDDVKHNNVLSNLAWGTQAENNADRMRNTGRIGDRPYVRGSAHFNNRGLTEADVVEIRRCAALGETQESLASRFPTSRGNVAVIVTGRTWKHVE